VHLSPLVWLMIACYCLSMILLGLAGVLHKRHWWCYEFHVDALHEKGL